jgi:D-alanine-D-alanine ligase
MVIKSGARKRRPADPLRIGFTFNVKRVDTKGGNDAEAEYDAPETIDAIREALESYGHQVLPFEATAELPRQLMETPVDLVFNIAEGVAGRNREAAVPALCELMGIPYTGSDAATLSIALDKALSKRVLLQHGILTAEFQLMETGRERLSPKLKFPLIIKPNQEGSSKGVSASASVVDDDAGLRTMVRELIDRYRQPALIEVYIPGREFTVGLLGDRRPRVLPPMEILFKDKTNQRPVYDFQIKQEWEKHVSYQCPADLTPAELKAIERVTRETFAALDCRDVSRVDLRMTAKGELYVIEVNPLPGLTPGYSDLCLIASAAGIDYRTLIGEILEGGLKRLREKRREARSAVSAGSGAAPNGNGNGGTPAPAAGGAAASGVAAATTPPLPVE